MPFDLNHFVIKSYTLNLSKARSISKPVDNEIFSVTAVKRITRQ